MTTTWTLTNKDKTKTYDCGCAENSKFEVRDRASCTTLARCDTLEQALAYVGEFKAFDKSEGFEDEGYQIIDLATGGAY